MYYHYGPWWGFFPEGILWVLLWIFVISLIFGRRRWWHRHDHWHDHDEEKTAKDVLDERFAKGEINEDEYEKRLATLKKHSK